MIGFYLMGFLLLVSGAGVVAAVAYAIRPSERRLMLMRPLSLAAVFAALCSCSVGVAMALKAAADAGMTPESVRVMTAGLSEATVPLFVAFALLSVAWLAVTIGLRRQP